MIDTQTGNASNGRILNHIGAIISTSNATLDHGSIDLLTNVSVKCHESQVSEIDWLGSWCLGILTLRFCRFFEAVPNLEEILRELLLGERLPVDLYPLSNKPQMRGCIQPDL